MNKIIGFSICGILFLGLLVQCGGKGEETTEPVRPVKIAKVASLSDLNSRVFPGITKEKDQATLAFRVSGPLIKLNIEEGQPIQKGELLAEIDPRDFEVDLFAKKARYEQLKAEKNRFEVLYKKESISKNELDLRIANFMQAESAYQGAKNALRDTRLLAPFNGFVQHKFVENFERVSVGQPIMSVVDISTIEVNLAIPERFVIFSSLFEKYSVEFDLFPDMVFNASLKEIGKVAQSGGEGFPMILYLDYPISRESEYQLTAGLTCRVRIHLADQASEAGAMTVPLTAIFEAPDEKETSVFVLNKKEMRVHKKKVTLGVLSGPHDVQIMGGLTPEDMVVTAGTHLLKDGQKVKILAERL